MAMPPATVPRCVSFCDRHAESGAAHTATAAMPCEGAVQGCKDQLALLPVARVPPTSLTAACCMIAACALRTALLKPTQPPFVGPPAGMKRTA